MLRLRANKRKMINVNATLGTGLYWRTGETLHQAGAMALFVSYLVVGIVAWSVMKCIGELLCIWPIPGAAFILVSELVDPELGIVVGIMYW
jgi:amino acid transporter